MHVFVTGATGWIGSAVTDRLRERGHRVTGLARSAESADSLAARGIEAVRGDLDSLEVLRAGAAAADAVVHLGFKHDFSDYAASGRTERAAVATLGDALAGSGRPLLLASGIASAPGTLLTESDASRHVGPDAPRGGSEAFALELANRGVRPVAVRFAPTVHGAGDHGFLAVLAAAARRTGVAGYVGDGTSSWAAVHRDDAADLVVRALEATAEGAEVRVVHAIAEEAVPSRRIAEALAEVLDVPTGSFTPDQAPAQFGFLSAFWGLDLRASSAATRAVLGWAPVGPTLVEDIRAGRYTGAPVGIA